MYLCSALAFYELSLLNKGVGSGVLGGDQVPPSFFQPPLKPLPLMHALQRAYCFLFIGIFHAGHVQFADQSYHAKSKESNLYYTRGITPKRETSCGANLRGLAPGQHSFEETSQRWRAVGDTVPIGPTRDLISNSTLFVYRRVKDICLQSV